MNKQQLNPSNNFKNNNDPNNQKPINRLVVIFVLMFIFGATLLVDSAFSSISHLFVVNENNDNNNGPFYSPVDINKNLRKSGVISIDEEFTLADTYLKKYYTEEQSRELFRNDHHNETQISSIHYEISGNNNNKNFRLVPHSFIENNDRTEIPFSPFGSKLTTYEECRNLCLKAGPKKCSYFSRSAFTPASSWNTNFENHKQSLHHILRSRERLKKDRCARRKRSSLFVKNQKSLLEERLKIIPKKCTFHYGFPNLVSSSPSPTKQRNKNLQDADEEAMMHEVWLPEELAPTSSSSVSQKTKNVNDDNDDENSLVAFALQVTRPKMQGVQSALGALATYLRDEPNVAVFLDRSDAVHVGVIGHLLEETIINSKKTKSISNQQQRCIKISQMLELFDDLVDGFDVQTAANDFINNTIHAKTETEEVTQWLSSFDSISNNKKEDLKSRLQRQFRHFTSSSASVTNKNSTSLKSASRDLDDEYHDRHGVPLSVPFQRYIGSPSTAIAREERTPFLLDDTDDRQKCFQQIFEASHHSFDLSHPIPNFFSASTTTTAQQEKGGSYDDRDRDKGGKLMIRFLNSVNHLFMSFGFPNSGSWMSLRAFHEVALFFPDSMWYFLLEDETFILMRSLKYLLRLATLSNQHRLSRNYYGFQMTVNPLPAHRHNFISSRSGILIPSVVMKELNLNMNTTINNKKQKQKSSSSSRISMCLAICRQNYIDERIACCMHGLDVGESHVNSFFPLRLGQSFPEVNFSHVTSFGNMKTFEDFVFEEEQQEYHSSSKREEHEEPHDDVERKQKQVINEDDEGLEDARIAMEMNDKLKPVRKNKNDKRNKATVKKANKVVDRAKSYFDDLVFAQDVLVKRKEIGEGCND